MIPTCCQTPTIVRFGECVLCVKDDCLGGWLAVQARKNAASAVRIKLIKQRGYESWLDFIQYWRCYAWRKAAEGAGSVGHLDVCNATEMYLQKQGSMEDPTEDTKPERRRQPTSKGSMSLEELIEAEAEHLTESHSAYRHTLANELVVLAGTSKDDKVVVLALAEQIEPQDAALLIRQPIKATVERMSVTRNRLREVA